MAGYVAISGSKTSTKAGIVPFGPFVAAPSLSAWSYSQIVTVGTNTNISIPAIPPPVMGEPNLSPNGVVIQPTLTNSDSLQFLWDSSDTPGIILGPTSPNLITFTSNPDLAPGGFILNCTGGTCNVQLIWF